MMLAYAIRRLLTGLVTLVLISFVVYGLVRAMPGDPASADFSDPDRVLTPRQIAVLRSSFDLDKPWTSGYVKWLSRAARGDLGRSLHRMEPVSTAIFQALGPTLLLSVASLLLAYGLSVPLGVYSAHRSGRTDERILSALLYGLYSFPSYVMAILLLLVFGVWLEVLPVGGMRSVDWDDLSSARKILDLLAHMVLPVFCYTYVSLAYITRFVRSNMMEALHEDYIRTARAKGLRERDILWKHAFPNTLIPFLTLVGLSLPALVGGSVILEQIFAWPGMGRLFFSAIETRDYTLIMGLTMMFSVLIVLGTLLADLLYAVVDPRVSYS